MLYIQLARGGMSNTVAFDQQVPRRLQYSLTKSILENYKQSSIFCYRNFATPQAKDLGGFLRRAKIEEEMAGVAALFKAISIKVQGYENNTGFYNEITCGAVKLTQSCISDPNIVPRFARFRATLAQNGQYSLFEFGSQPNNKQYVYAILTHGVDPNSEKRSWPGFIKIQFPNETCTKYIDEGIDLLARFPDLRTQYIPNGQVLLRLKRRTFRKRAQEA
jgi:hypothetical protein